MNATLVRMPADRLRGWMLAANAQYRLERIEAGETEAEATAKAAQSLAETFPAGRIQVGHLVFEVVLDEARRSACSGSARGARATRTSGGSGTWRSTSGSRGRGFGRQAMQLAETAAKEQGAKTLGLNVFGFNRIARGLYESLGYETMAVQMRKALCRSGRHRPSISSVMTRSASDGGLGCPSAVVREVVAAVEGEDLAVEVLHLARRAGGNLGGLLSSSRRAPGTGPSYL